MEQKPANQEIDLLELLAKLFTTLKNNKALVILCPVLGLAVGLAIYYIKNVGEASKQTIQSAMMISTDLLSENEAKFLCNDFNTGDTLPGLTKKQRNSILILTSEVKKEEINDKKILVSINISLTTTDRNILPVLQGGLIKHFDESEPVIRQSAARKRLYTELIKKIDEEMGNLEQLKAQKISPTDLTKRIIDLSEKKINYQISLEGSNSVHLVKGFITTSANQPSTTSRMLYGMAGLLAGIFITIFILFIKFFRNYYKSYEQAQR